MPQKIVTAALVAHIAPCFAIAAEIHEGRHKQERAENEAEHGTRIA